MEKTLHFISFVLSCNIIPCLYRDPMWLDLDHNVSSYLFMGTKIERRFKNHNKTQATPVSDVVYGSLFLLM